MAAIVHDALCESHWTDIKPATYKAQDLEKALRAYELAVAKVTDIPKDLMPAVPNLRINTIDTCIGKLKVCITELDKYKTMLGPTISALKAAQAAASKTAADLVKQAKAGGVDEKQYATAAAEAARIAGLASKAASIYQ